MPRDEAPPIELATDGAPADHSGPTTDRDPVTDVDWLNADQLKDWVALVAMISTLPSALDAQLKRDAGLNFFEYGLLAHLSEAPQGRVPMSDLALLAQASPSRLTHAVSRLERAGYVRKTECHEAGRRTATVLTETGREKLAQTAPGHVRQARRLVVDALSAEQFAALGDASRAVAAAVDPALAEGLRKLTDEALGTQPA